MDSKELLEALENLKSNLTEIQSARTQVEKTVNTSSELQKIVGRYIDSIQNFQSVLDSWEQSIHERSNELVNSTEAAKVALSNIGDTVAKRFGESTNATLAAFKEQVKLLGNNVNFLDMLREEIKSATKEIQSIKEKLFGISKDLTDSQKMQDETLEHINQQVSELPGTIKGYADGIKEHTNSKKDDLKRILDETHSIILAIDKKLDALTQAAATLQTTSKGIQQSCDNIKSTVDNIESDILSSNNAIKKSISINRWLLIAGVIILIVLHFSIFAYYLCK